MSNDRVAMSGGGAGARGVTGGARRPSEATVGATPWSASGWRFVGPSFARGAGGVRGESIRPAVPGLPGLPGLPEGGVRAGDGSRSGSGPAPAAHHPGGGRRPALEPGRVAAGPANHPGQDGPAPDRPRQDRPRQDRPSQDGPRQDRPSQDRPSQDGPGQDGPGQDGPGQDGPASSGARADAQAEDALLHTQVQELDRCLARMDTLISLLEADLERNELMLASIAAQRLGIEPPRSDPGSGRRPVSDAGEGGTR